MLFSNSQNNRFFKRENQYLTFSFVWFFCSDIFILTFFILTFVILTFFIIFVVKIFICFGIFGRMFHHFGWFDLGEKSINVTWLSLNALSAPSLPPLVQIFGGVSSSSTAIITKNAFFPLQPTKIKKNRDKTKKPEILEIPGRTVGSPWKVPDGQEKTPPD